MQFESPQTTTYNKLPIITPVEILCPIENHVTPPPVFYNLIESPPLIDDSKQPRRSLTQKSQQDKVENFEDETCRVSFSNSVKIKPTDTRDPYNL